LSVSVRGERLAPWEGGTLLAVALLLVDGGTLAYLMAIEPTSHTWWFVGDLDAAGALLTLGAAVFPAATVLACRLERCAVPRFFDHLRHCAVLYLLLVAYAVFLWPARHADGGSLGFAVVTLGAAGALIGIATNALTLAWLARRARPARGARAA
jgi:hypothetical protein